MLHFSSSVFRLLVENRKTEIDLFFLFAAIDNVCMVYACIHTYVCVCVLCSIAPD